MLFLDLSEVAGVFLFQALIALSSVPPMRGACYMTVMPLYLNDTLGMCVWRVWRWRWRWWCCVCVCVLCVCACVCVCRGRYVVCCNRMYL